MGFAAAVPVLIVRLMFLFPVLSSLGLGTWLHSGSPVEPVIVKGVFEESAASLVAVYHLLEYGVSGIRVCEAVKVEAPVSGYLVALTGEWSSHDGDFSLFRVFVRDDEESPAHAGDTMGFLAVDPSDPPVMHTYPIMDQGWEELFLLYEEAFMTVTARYP